MATNKPIPIFLDNGLPLEQLALAARLFMSYPVTQEEVCDYIQRSPLRAEKACELRRLGKTHKQAIVWLEGRA